MAEANPLDGSAPKHLGVIGILFASASLSVIASGLIIYTLADGTLDFFLSEEAELWEFLTNTRWVPNMFVELQIPLDNCGQNVLEIKSHLYTYPISLKG